jgi:hypothetical protein
LAEILEAYVSGEMTNVAAANAVVYELADLEESLQSTPHEVARRRLFIRAYWATEQLGEAPEYRTDEGEVQYLLSCLIGDAEYDEERANAFYKARES